MDDRQKVRLIQPDRLQEKSKKFNLVSTQNTGYIGKPVGQEFDTYDEVMKKYMRKLERGQIRPQKDANGNSVKVDPTTTHMPGTNGIWRSNNYHMKLLQDTKPLLDRTHTPRGALRAITLDRNFSQ